MEFAIWGKKKGREEDIIKINGEEVQKSLNRANQIKDILTQRGEFESIRLQKINLKKGFNLISLIFI